MLDCSPFPTLQYLGNSDRGQVQRGYMSSGVYNTSMTAHNAEANETNSCDVPAACNEVVNIIATAP